MRNLKKVLALVLALMMALSLMVTASASDYKDDSSIEKDVAVDVMSALEVFNGIGGEFQPEGTLTRAQAAKIIAYMQLGKENADIYLPELANSQMFDDVQPTKWYAGAVNYCASLGIVNGVGNNKFNPNSPVKGYEFAKMLMGALGYSAEIEGFNASDPKVGSLWTLNVSRKANALSVPMNTNVSYSSKELTREEACQMAFNILTVATMTYVGENNTPTPAAPLGTTVFNLESATGVVKAIGAVTKVDSTDYAIASDPSLLGHNVTVFFSTTEEDDDGNKIGYTITDNSTTVELTGTEETDKAAVAAALGVEVADVTWTSVPVLDASLTTQTGNQTGWPAEAGTLIITVSSGAKTPIGFAKATAYFLDQVTAIDKDGNATLKDGGPLKDKTGSMYKDVAVDDYVTYYKIGTKYYVSAAETVVGALSAFDDGSVTVGGTKYKVVTTNNKAGLTNVVAGSLDFTTEYTVYLNPNGTAFAVVAPEGAKTASNFVYVIKHMEIVGTGTYGEKTESYALLCMDMDGNVDTYKTNAEIGDKDGEIVALTEDEDHDGCYKIDDTAGVLDPVQTIDEEESEARTIAADAATIAANHYYGDSVKFIYVEGEEVTVVEGVQKVVVPVKAEATAAAYAYYIIEDVDGDDTNKLVNLVIVLGGVPEADPEYSTDVIFANEAEDSSTRAPYTDADGAKKTGYSHTVYINGEKKTIVTSTAGKLVGFKNYAMDGDAYVVKNASGDHLTAELTFTNVFQNRVTVDGDTIPANTSAAGATVINTKNDDDITVSKLTGCKGYCVMSEDGKTVVTVYVTDVPAEDEDESDEPTKTKIEISELKVNGTSVTVSNGAGTVTLAELTKDSTKIAFTATATGGTLAVTTEDTTNLQAVQGEDNTFTLKSGATVTDNGTLVFKVNAAPTDSETHEAADEITVTVTVTEVKS